MEPMRIPLGSLDSRSNPVREFGRAQDLQNVDLEKLGEIKRRKGYVRRLYEQQPGPIRLLFSYGGLCGRFPQFINGGALVYTVGDPFPGFPGEGDAPGVYTVPSASDDETLVGLASFSSASGSGGVDLSWVYSGGELPEGASGVIILRSETDFPTHPGGAGTVVFQGPETSTTDDGVSGTGTYYYSAWVEYPSSGYSERATSLLDNFWEQVYTSDGYVSAVGMARHSGKLYAIMTGLPAVLESGDGGEWAVVDARLASETNMYSVHSIESFNGALLSASGNTYRSTDNGVSWATVDADPGVGVQVFGTNAYRYEPSGFPGLERSADGVTWANAGAGFTFDMVEHSDGYIYATGVFGVNTALFRSLVSDGGTWSLAINMTALALGILESHDGAIYYTARDTGRLFKTTNGTTYSELSLPTASGRIWSLRSYKGRLFMGVEGDSTKVWWTEDGSSWTLAVDLPGDQTVAGLYADTDYIYALTGRPVDITNTPATGSDAGARIYRSPTGLGDFR